MSISEKMPRHARIMKIEEALASVMERSGFEIRRDPESAEWEVWIPGAFAGEVEGVWVSLYAMAGELEGLL